MEMSKGRYLSLVGCTFVTNSLVTSSLLWAVTALGFFVWAAIVALNELPPEDRQ